ncbi:MAG: hypothetical protein GKR87_13095 [Kiritimatiellae bacterium]|nr:hypothetical protein [Kiritimatiellia bacterium]
MENSVKRFEEVEILIIGFGFSCIPLLRELDADQVTYTIVSDVNPIWKQLEQADRLDFDLVSSYYSSFYSSDLVQSFKTDMYPTAKESYAMHQKYLQQYKSHIHFDHVELIENYSAYSIIHTKSGKQYKTKKLVISTGFKRKIHDDLGNFDYTIKDKTVLFTTMGDSANLMISKLIPRGNKAVIVNQGFIALDKIRTLGGRTYTLDQLEFHNVSYRFPVYCILI